jgi:NAD(P)-dependent dehydrogenase (short-subunit alcohol dehydrogenase family)
MPAPGPPLPFTQTRRNDIYHDISPYPSGALEGSAAGLTVVITGAGRGLGRSLAIVFAKAGAKVVITSRSAHELDEVEATIQKDVEGATIVKVITDVTDEKSVEALFEKAQNVNGASETTPPSTTLFCYLTLDFSLD